FFSDMNQEYFSLFTNKDYTISIVTDESGSAGINDKCHVSFYNEHNITFNVVYKYNVDLNIDKNPFGLELEYSITDGTNT
ncbi:MAG: hypothetical protein GX365_03255, partial [Clostridiales bacterium]|nr:hypothetical protein [Clostridiales bacterium]